MGVTPGQRGPQGWWLRWDDPERRQQRREERNRQNRLDESRDRPKRPGATLDQPDLEKAMADWAGRLDRATLPWWRRLLGRSAK